MITIIDKMNFSNIHEILIEYGKEIRKDDSPKTTINQYTEFIDDPDFELYYYSDDNSNQGMSLIHLQEEIMCNFYMKKSNNSTKSEIKFFDWMFHKLKNKTGGFISQFSLFSDIIIKHMTKLGVEPIKRHVMLIDGSKISGLSEPILDDQYKFASWSESYIDKCAELIVDAHEGTLDSQIFVFYQQIKGSKEFLKQNSANKFGKFDKNIESVLLENADIIGLCSFNITENKGFIPSIVISPKKRGLGLGKSLLIHTMKDLYQKHEIESVGLLVTERNQTAYQLYNKLGFKTVDIGFTYLK